MSKGSARRPRGVSYGMYSTNHDRIFGASNVASRGQLEAVPAADSNHAQTVAGPTQPVTAQTKRDQWDS